jgi:hypothetical protein
MNRQIRRSPGMVLIIIRLAFMIGGFDYNEDNQIILRFQGPFCSGKRAGTVIFWQGNP